MPQNSKITTDSKISRSEDILFSDISNDIVMLNIDTGTYFALDDIAAYIWKQLAVPTTVESLCQNLIARYDVSFEKCRQDVVVLLNGLHQQALIEIHASGE